MKRFTGELPKPKKRRRKEYSSVRSSALEAYRKKYPRFLSSKGKALAQRLRLLESDVDTWDEEESNKRRRRDHSPPHRMP